MSPVLRAFVARRGSGADNADSAPLRDAVEAALARAREAWPALEVLDERFGDALAERVGDDADVPAAIAKMNAGDLYFVLACAAGDATALAELEKRHLADVAGALERVGFPAAAIDESLQVLRETLLVAGEHGAPRILEFGARGQLRGWLRVVATRIAFRLARPARKNVAFDESLGEQAKGDLELDYLKKKYGSTFQDAFREALATLPVPDRLLLKQRFALNTTVIELGALHGVHASTISRRVAYVRARLVTATREGMMRRLRLGAPEVSSILRLIQSQLDISLSSYRDPDVRDVSG